MAHQTDKQYRMADLFGKEVTDQNGMFFGPQLGTNYYKIFMPKINAACHAINTHDAMQDRIAALETKLGLTEITLDCKLTLLESCEKALVDRDSKIPDIQAKAIEDFQTYFDKEYYGEELSQFIEQYADRLRQQTTPADISTQVNNQEKTK